MFYEKSSYNTNPANYKLHTYDKIHEYNHYHDYTHVHDYKKIHKYDKIHTYDKVREYKYQEYKPIKQEPKKKRQIHSAPVFQPIKRKRKPGKDWPDKPIYTHTYRPYEYHPPPPYRDYIYTEYESNNEDYLKKKILPYKGSVDYKLTPDNFYPFRYRKGKQRKRVEDENNNDEQIKRETSLRDIELKDDVLYKPEYRREPILPTAFVYAPKPKVQRKPSPVYQPETRQEETLPTAFVIAPMIKKAVKPETPLYQPETRQEPVLPTAYVYAPKKIVKEERQRSPVIQRVAATRAVRSEKTPSPEQTKRRSSPARTRTVYTPIGSRSSSPGLAPVGAAFVGGFVGGAVVNKKRSPTPQKEVQKTPSPTKNDTHDKDSRRSVTPTIATAAVIGGTAAVVRTSTPKPKEKVRTPTPKPKEQSPERKPTPVKENETKQEKPPSPAPKTEPEPVRNEPKQPETRNDAPAAIAVVAPLTKSKKKPSPLQSKNEEYKEVPSSWSPLSFKGPSLPPEVIFTIEAYNKAHSMG